MIEMHVLDFNEEKHDRSLREEGKEEGLAEGIGIGKEDLLAELVCRKLRKEKSLDDIVDELETEESLIKPIYDIAAKHAPEYDIDEVLKELHGERIP